MQKHKKSIKQQSPKTQGESPTKKPYPTLILITIILCPLLLAGNIQYSNASSGTKVSGILTSDTTWTQTNSPYTLTGAVGIITGVKLTIEPGVTLNLNNHYIQVNGTLSARGTEIAPIKIGNGSIRFMSSSTAWNEQTNLGSIIENAHFKDVSQVDNLIYIENCAPKINRVRMIFSVFTSAIDSYFAEPIISNCTLSGSKSNGEGYTAVEAWNSNITVSDNTFYRVSRGVLMSDSGNSTIVHNTFCNSQTGIRIIRSNVQIENNTLIKNDEGIDIGSESRSIIRFNNMINNTCSVSANTVLNVDASSNWWGTTDSDTIGSTIYDFHDDFTLGNVTFNPYLITQNLMAPLIPTFNISASAGPGGSISPTGNITATYGDDLHFTIESDGGYYLSTILINGSLINSGSSLSLEYIDNSYWITAVFEAYHYTNTIQIFHIGEGTVTPADGYQTVEFGSNITLSATPAENYAFMCWLEGGLLLSTENPYNYTVNSNQVITAVFYDPVAKGSPTPTPTQSSSSSSSSSSSASSSSGPSSTASPTPTPSVPEFPTFLLFTMLVAALLATGLVKRKWLENKGSAPSNAFPLIF